VKGSFGPVTDHFNDAEPPSFIAPPHDRLEPSLLEFCNAANGGFWGTGTALAKFVGGDIFPE